MNKIELERLLDINGIKAKILWIEKTDWEDYNIIYTFDLNYEGKTNYSNIIVIEDPERDILATDYEEALEMISKRWCTHIKETGDKQL